MTKTATRTTDITLNGRPISTAATTLAALLVEQGLADAKVATAVNGEFVGTRARSSAPIAAGDSVEILSARQGG
jgi:sulfur carrier protein